MATIDQLKTALGNMFYKDLSRFEPGAKGVAVGEYLRVYDEGESFKLRFLNGTPPSQRKPIMDRLDLAKVPYSCGDDYTL